MSEFATSHKPIHILLIEDDPEQLRTIWNLLHEKSVFTFEVESVTLLSEGLLRLNSSPADAVLLDLSLISHQQEREAVTAVCEAAPGVAVVVITELQQENSGLRAMEGGAQDYLLKEEINTRSLIRALHYAVERKRAGEAISQSERRYRTLFETMDEGFCIIQMLFDENETAIDYRFLETNPVFERQSGLVNAVGKRIREFAPEHEAYWVEIYGKVALTGEAIRFESHVAQLHRFFDIHAFRFGTSVEGQVAVLFNDITERKRADELLQRSVEQNAFRLRLTDALRPLTEPIAIQMMAAHLLGQHLKVNRIHFGEITADDAYMVVEQDYTDGVSKLSGHFQMSDFGPLLIDSLRAGRTLVMPDVDGSTLLSDAEKAAYERVQIAAQIGVPLVKGDQLVAVLSIHQAEARDWTPDEVTLVEEIAERTWAAVERVRAETARRASDTQLHLLEQRRLLAVEATGVADWETDLNSGEYYWSPRMFELFGVSGDSKPSLDFIVAHIHPEDRQGLLDVRSQAVAGTNEGRYRVQFRVEHESGDMRWLESRGQVIFGDPVTKRQPLRITGTLIDITQQKQSEAQERAHRVLAETLRDTAVTLNTTHTIEEVLERALAVAPRLVPFDAAYLCFLQGDTLIHFASVGFSDKERAAVEQWHRRMQHAATHPLYRRATTSGQPTIHVDLRARKRKLLPVPWVRGAMVAPIQADTVSLGYFVAVCRTSQGFDPGDQAKLQAFSYQIAAAVGNVQHFLQVQTLAALQERQHFARDLHDAVSQTLFAASILLDSLLRQQEHDPQAMPELLAELNGLIKGALSELRLLILHMRPMNLQTTPFTQLLDHLTTALQARKRIAIHKTFEGEPKLPPDVNLVIFRIMQETLNNIAKHAHATELRIQGRGGQGYVELYARDNGRGFSPTSKSGGLGLQMMQERANEIGAQLEIRSSPGNGTETRLIYPASENP